MSYFGPGQRARHRYIDTSQPLMGLGALGAFGNTGPAYVGPVGGRHGIEIAPGAIIPSADGPDRPNMFTAIWSLLPYAPEEVQAGTLGKIIRVGAMKQATGTPGSYPDLFTLLSIAASEGAWVFFDPATYANQRAGTLHVVPGSTNFFEWWLTNKKHGLFSEGIYLVQAPSNAPLTEAGLSQFRGVSPVYTGPGAASGGAAGSAWTFPTMPPIGVPAGLPGIPLPGLPAGSVAPVTPQPSATPGDATDRASMSDTTKLVIAAVAVAIGYFAYTKSGRSMRMNPGRKSKSRGSPSPAYRDYRRGYDQGTAMAYEGEAPTFALIRGVVKEVSFDEQGRVKHSQNVAPHMREFAEGFVDGYREHE